MEMNDQQEGLVQRETDSVTNKQREVEITEHTYIRDDRWTRTKTDKTIELHQSN